MQPSGVNVIGEYAMFVGNTTTCPVCRRAIPIIEGEFILLDDTIKVLSAPDWTVARLRELRDVLAWAQSTYESHPREAVDRLAQVSPDVAQSLLSLAGSGGVANVINFLVLLLAALSLLITVRDEHSTITPGQVQEIISQVVQDVHGDQEDPLPPSLPPGTARRLPPTVAGQLNLGWPPPGWTPPKQK